MKEKELTAALEGPVTSIIRRRVRAGKETDFERWSREIATVCQKFEGYMGTRIIHPAAVSEEHIAIVTFDCYQNYDKWIESDERKKYLLESEDLTEGVEVSRTSAISA